MLTCNTVKEAAFIKREESSFSKKNIFKFKGDYTMVSLPAKSSSWVGCSSLELKIFLKPLNLWQSFFSWLY